ncbi:MAG TPA: hypothetical protein VHU80_10580 [Polyangiaceae bacterium]|nr:hypothetical protein [Polyangiaceae bacterium]
MRPLFFEAALRLTRLGTDVRAPADPLRTRVLLTGLDPRRPSELLRMDDAAPLDALFFFVPRELPLLIALAVCCRPVAVFRDPVRPLDAPLRMPAALPRDFAPREPDPPPSELDARAVRRELEGRELPFEERSPPSSRVLRCTSLLNVLFRPEPVVS